jgi:hypothetical protein
VALAVTVAQQACGPALLLTLCKLSVCFLICLLQLGESLEEQLGQRLLRMPPPPQLPPRVRQGQQHTIEQQQQPSMFQLPYEVPPVLTDPMQVCGLRSGRGAASAAGAALLGSGSLLIEQSRLMQPAMPVLVKTGRIWEAGHTCLLTLTL